MPNDTGVLEDEFMTHRQHEDPDRHWLGEGLPRPSDAELDSINNGLRNFAGTSKFPAAADHSHDHRMRWSAISIASKSVPAGTSTFIDTLTGLSISEDFMNPGSNQLFSIPQEGEYEVWLLYVFTRSTGTFTSPPSRYSIDLFRNNGTIQLPWLTNLNYQVGTSAFRDTCTNVINLSPSLIVPPLNNYQLRVTNGDTVAVTFAAQFRVRRLHTSL